MKKIEKLNEQIKDWVLLHGQFPFSLYDIELDLDEDGFVEVVAMQPIWIEILHGDKRYLETLEAIWRFVENKNPIDEFLKRIAVW